MPVCASHMRVIYAGRFSAGIIQIIQIAAIPNYSVAKNYNQNQLKLESITVKINYNQNHHLSGELS